MLTDETVPAADLLAPTPVRTVPRLGWTWRDGFPVVPVPYDP